MRSTTEPSAEQALLTHFRYYPTLHCVSRSQYTDSEWLDLMQSELDAARPILYSAGGHALVDDGYDGDRRLHFNLGWGGQCNGFYTIDDLCLASGLSPYTPHEAIIGIRPNTDNVDTAIVQGVASDTLGGYCTGNGEYPYGQLVSLMAHTAEGYRFDGWTSGHLDNPRHFPATIHFSDTALIHSIASDTLYYCTPIEDNNWDHNTVGTITRLGIRIPSNSLHGERAVYAVQFYKNLPSFRIMNLYIHSGATPPEEDSSSFRHTFLAPRYAVGWITLNLDSSVVIDTTADLWIVFEDENGIIEDLYGHTTYGATPTAVGIAMRQGGTPSTASVSGAPGRYAFSPVPTPPPPPSSLWLTTLPSPSMSTTAASSSPVPTTKSSKSSTSWAARFKHSNSQATKQLPQESIWSKSVPAPPKKSS